MALDLLALVLLALFAWRGARRGALAAGLSLAALIVGYAAAWVASERLGDVAAASVGAPALLGGLIAGTGVFFSVTAAFGLVAWLAQRRRTTPLTPASRAGGALFGALRGSLVVLAIGLLSLWADAWKQMLPGADPHAPVVETPLRAATRVAVAAGVEAALGDAPGAAIAAHALTQPGAAMEQIRTLAARPEIAALASDHELWTLVEAGSYDAALAQPSFQSLQWNGERRRELAALGVVDAAAAGDPAVFALEARAALVEVGPRLRELRNDPELARLANDPAVANLLERQDLLGLLSHPAVQHALTRALAREPNQG